MCKSLYHDTEAKAHRYVLSCANAEAKAHSYAIHVFLRDRLRGYNKRV